jgi:hypothetical protein
MSHRIRRILLAALVAAAATPAAAQEGGDLEAQILYSYQTEAAGRLDELRTNLRAELDGDAARPAARYHLAHADYRAAQLLGASRKSAASAALEECIAQLNILAKSVAPSAEIHALRGACYSQLAALSSVESIMCWRRSAADLAAAYRLEPANPRVRLLRSLDLAARPKMLGGDPALAFTELQGAAELFDKSAATRLDAPSWGHADAYLELGLALEARHDLIGARNALEKALLSAADSKRAQSALAALGK